MSPKIKMTDIHDDRDDDIIELTEDDLKEILADEDFDAEEETAPIPEYYFSNPDPYAKVEPRPNDAPKRDFSFDEKGNIVVKNPSAFWLPEITITEEIGGTEFILITQQKTEKKVYIPVDRRVRAILAKYDGKLPPVHSNEMNKLVKTIGLLLGWTHDCGFDEKRLNPKRGRRFCDMLLSHTARRSFATNAYKAGVPLPSIQAITGHSSEAQLRRYLKLDAEEKAVIALKDFKGIIKI